MKTKSLLFILGALGGAAASSYAGGLDIGVGIRLGAPAPVRVHHAPPRALVETVVVSPGPGYVWIAGHYVWERNNWVWVRGAWELPPQPGAVWVAGQFNAQNWIEGHWEVTAIAPPGPPPPPPGAGPGPGPSEIIVTEAPPPPQQEVIIAQPSPRHVWVAGYWGWRGGRHTWVAGHWEMPPRERAVWIAPRWERRGGSYVFIEGSWR